MAGQFFAPSLVHVDSCVWIVMPGGVKSVMPIGGKGIAWGYVAV